MIQILLFVHVLSAASWLSAAIWVAGDVRRTLALGKPFVTALPQRLLSAVRADQWAGTATLLTGFALIGYQEMAMKTHPRMSIVLGLLLAVVRLGLYGALLSPAAKRLVARIQAGEDVPAADPAAKRIAMVNGIGHLLWVLILACMFWY